VTTDFQKKLQSITFKTFYQNQLTTLDFDDLFANRRVIVFSTTRMSRSGIHIKSFDDAHPKWSACGIDAVYAINSRQWLIGPWIDKHYHSLIGLPDRDLAFVEAMATHCGLNKTIEDAATHWEYIAIIKNGDVEKVWKNLFATNMPVTVTIQKGFMYHNLSVDQVIKYLEEV